MRLKLVPDSLFGRLLMALVATMGVTLVVIVALLLQERRDLLSARSETAGIVNVISSTAEEIAALPREDRAAAIERLQREPLAIDSAAAQPRQGPFVLEDSAKAARAVRERLTRALGRGYTVAVEPAQRGGNGGAIRVGRALRMQFERNRSRFEGGPPPEAGDAERREGPFGGPPPGDELREGGARDGGPAPRVDRPPRLGSSGGFGPPALDVAVTLPDGDLLRFRADVPRAPPPLPAALLLELVFVTMALAAVLYAMARTITRPLASLAAAADAVGRGARYQPLPEIGARELRDATHAFNTMQERLHRYLDSRTRVLSAMSHDLRTPLTRLKLRAESLDDERLRERFNADLDEMNRMVQGALDLFKGVNHDEPLREVRVEDLVEQIRAEFAELGAPVSVSGGTARPLPVRRDALKRCLTNLVGNAVKYGARADVRVEERGGDVVVHVGDEGPGVPPEMLERVFEPFFRLESSRNVDTGGVGLGLSIARDVAQSHGGSLVLRNREPRGLDAVLTLPRTAP